MKFGDFPPLTQTQSYDLCCVREREAKSCSRDRGRRPGGVARRGRGACRSKDNQSDTLVFIAPPEAG